MPVFNLSASVLSQLFISFLWLLCRGQRRHNACVKYWEIIADNLSKAGWSWGCVSAIDSNGRTIWIADAHRDDGKRFVVRADEKLTAFVELEWRFALISWQHSAQTARSSAGPG
jgi:hypothetical protein